MILAGNNSDSRLKGHILIVDDHARARESMSEVLRHAGHTVCGCTSAVQALEQLNDSEYDVVVTDLKMPGMDGLEFIRALNRRNLDVPVLMVTAHATIPSAVEAMRHGVLDYIEKPFDAEQLEELVRRAIEAANHESPATTVSSAEANQTDHPMIGDAEAMRKLRQRIARIAPTNETVLITGESGVGKEVVAKAIHAQSKRNTAAMIGLNCPALSEQLMESELFGHERGAFTSADTPRVGRFELADGGTLLLDEVTEIALPLQAKLLRVLQERSFERVGSSESVSVDVRLLATTNRDIRGEIAGGRFREDLYFRLAVVPLRVPSLREHREDIPVLTNHFIQRSAARIGVDAPKFDDDAHDLLIHYDWPGNVRELENIVTRAIVLNTGSDVTADQLRPWLISHGEMDKAPDDAISGVPVGLSLQDMERQLIEATLERFDGHRASTAKALGIGVRTLCNKLRSYGYAPREKHRGQRPTH